MSKVRILGKDIDMSDSMGIAEACLERMELRDYALDFITDYTTEELAQLVREGIVTLDEVEDKLRRSILA